MNVNQSLSPALVGGSQLNSGAGNSASVGGRRASKKLRMVKKKTVKRMLKKMGLKMRGGDPNDNTAKGAVDAKLVPESEEPGSASVPEEGSKLGGRRRRGKKSRKTRRKSLFGLKY